MNTPADWDPTDPLLPGENVLIEASAGTGKTYQTEGLVARLVAEGHASIHQILAITFTRAAAAELRGRIRERLAQIRQALHDPTTADPDDLIAATLLAQPGQRAQYLANVERGLADYDQATISTIHSFCQEMLASFALLAGQDPAGQQQVEREPLNHRMADDLLAAVMTQLDSKEWHLLESTGWEQGATKDHVGLRGLAALASEAHVGSVEPSAGSLTGTTNSEVSAAVIDALREWIAERKTHGGTFLQWLDGPNGASAQSVFDGPSIPKWTTNWKKLPSPWAAIRSWLLEGAAPSPTAEAAFDLLLRARDKWESKFGSPTSTNPLDDLHASVLQLQTDLRINQPPFLPAALLWFRSRHREMRNQRGLQTFASMLSDLAEALEREDGQPQQPLREAIRSRYTVALVDEFQDTDESQWAVIRRVFLESATHRLYVVGDPKQAIYRFRGANVGVYRQARDEVASPKQGGRLTRLPKNYRSDAKVVDAMNGLWGAGEAFGLPDLTYAAIASAHGQRLVGAGAPLQLRWITPGVFGGSHDGTLNKQSITNAAYDAAARYIAGLIQTPSIQIKGRVDPRLSPTDFAVLCRSHEQTKRLKQALADVGVYAVRKDPSSVFTTQPATWLMHWLEAVAATQSEPAVRRAALTPLVGWTAKTLEEATRSANDAWIGLRRTFTDVAERWSRSGLGPALDRFLQAHGADARLLASAAGERGAADLYQLMDLLDAHQRTSRLGPAGLANWLRQQAVEASNEGDGARVVESDRPAVTLSTIHASKGLQFGIVLVPFCFYGFSQKDGLIPVRYTRPGPSGGIERVVDLHPPWHNNRAQAVTTADAEVKQEDMRLLYVALTRARHQVVVWGANYVKKTRSGNPEEYFGEGPLGRLLGCAPDLCQLETDQEVADLLQHVDSQTWQATLEPELTPTPPVQPDQTRLPTEFHPWTRTSQPGAGWQLSSFSALARSKGVDLDEPQRESPDADTVDRDPSDDAGELPDAPPPPLDKPIDSLLGPASGIGFHGGTGTGNWIHQVLEEIDFTRSVPSVAPDDPNTAPQPRPVGPADEPLADLLLRTGRANRVLSDAQYQLAFDQVDGWLDTPLDGPGLQGLPAGFSLRQLQRADRLDELQFHLRVGGGIDRRSASSPLVRLDESKARAALQVAADDPDFGGARWVRALLDRTRPTKTGGYEPSPVLPAFAGFLRGFVDLTFRAGGRYFVSDYKTNQVLGNERVREANRSWGHPPGWEEDLPPKLRRWHYSRSMLAWSMDHSAYHLQALVYTVAVHRMLKRRLPDYDYDTHFGGHLYLYVRGMEGDATPSVDGACLGVWTDRWPKATVEGLSAAFGGES